MNIISYQYNRATEELFILYRHKGMRLLSVKGIELYEVLRREGYAQDYDYKAGRLINHYSYNVSDPRGIHGIIAEERECTLPIEDFMECELGGASGDKLAKDIIRRYNSDAQRKFLKRLKRVWKIITTPIIQFV